MGKQKVALVLLLVLCFVMSTPPLVIAAEDSWISKESMNEARAYLGAVVGNGKIYVIGGYSIITHSILNVAEVYDSTSNTWITISPPPQDVDSYASAVVDNKIYTLGQEYSAWETFIQVYDLATDNWSIKGSTPVCAFASATGTSGLMTPKRIYFFYENRTDVSNPADDS